MDPLSVAASITGLLTASIEVAKLFAAFMDAYDYARTVYDEIQHFRFILYQLDKYIQSRSINIARASMIDLDQVVTVLMGSMFTFSELEREVKRLQSRPEGLRRMWWTMAKSNLVDLIQRLQNHKGTMCSMLLILTSDSQDEALYSMGELQSQVAELVRINAEMAKKLDSAIGGSVTSSGASIAASTMTAQSVLSFASVRTNFATTLNNSRVYRRALLGRVTNTKQATKHASAPSIQQSWSVLSGISLSEISNYAVFSLPISAQELYNPNWYTNPGPIIGLDPSIPEIPAFLTLGFVEHLKISLKQDDAETAKSIANYIPWSLALKLSAVYPKLSPDASNAPGELLDNLTLFRLWLDCGGNPETKDQHGQTALHYASVSGYEDVAEVLLKHGAAIEASDQWGINALHIASNGGYKDVVEVLLKHGAVIDAMGQQGMNALHYASENGYKDVVEVLLKHGAAIKTRDQFGMNALLYASNGGYKDMVEVLLKHGAVIDAIGPKGMNSLDYASENGYKDVVEVLLKHGAAIEARDQFGKNALQYASNGGYKDVVEVLGAGKKNLNMQAASRGFSLKNF